MWSLVRLFLFKIQTKRSPLEVRKPKTWRLGHSIGFYGKGWKIV